MSNMILGIKNKTDYSNELGLNSELDKHSKSLFYLIPLILSIVLLFSCNFSSKNKNADRMEENIRLITLNPGHFHSALVQKNSYDKVDNKVHIYAPVGNDVQLHINRITGFNSRSNNPTNWDSKIYIGTDFFEKMLSEKNGNVVVLAGNNQKKTAYIFESINAGLNVLADKPMAINVQGFDLLKKSFELAKKNNVVLYDIMTERFEITSILQKELVNNKGIFGEIEMGTIENPAVIKESVHYFFKYVSGNALTRPAWYFDTEQQGEGIVDVTTHLVDLIQWQCFPEIMLDYEKDVKLNTAKRWPTKISASQFKEVTKIEPFPEYLKKDIESDSVLNVFCNGEINYQLKGIHSKVSVTWNYRASDGAGDTHFSTIRGTKANLIIRQGAEQGYKPSLYIEPKIIDEEYAKLLSNEFSIIENKNPGIYLKENKNGWEVIIPEEYKVGHEAHFSQVTERYIEYLTKRNMPEWEVPNMIAKYYTTTMALDMARNNKSIKEK